LLDRPAIDFDAGFAAVAKAAGLGANFDPFGNETNFVLGACCSRMGIRNYVGTSRLHFSKRTMQAQARHRQILENENFPRSEPDRAQ
jgi:hypothetical protein